MKTFKKQKAFTLAEVLITLSIIGVVAAITMPVLIGQYKQSQYITAFKKVYSEISQANQLLNAEYNGNWTNECSTFDNICMRELFSTKIKTIKKCDTNEGCQSESKFLDGTVRSHDYSVNAGWPSLISSSGYSIKFRFHQTGCESYYTTNYYLDCAWMTIDTNGLKAPNVVGKDVFFLHLYSDGTIRGITPDTVMTATNQNINQNYDINEVKEDCLNGSGYYCAAYYLQQ